jgi:Kef-type K+ transport system membrane component KefB
VALRLRQPVLIAYIVVGILVGPAGFGLVSAHDQIDLLAQMGIAVLLFLVGLKLDLAHVRHIGPVALATGLGQLVFTIAIGFGLVLLLGRTPVEALYLAVALMFSSTIIIVKLLSDKRKIDALHGRIAVGFLIVQDLAVVLAMMVVSALGGGGEPAEVILSLLWRVGLEPVALYLASSAWVVSTLPDLASNRVLVQALRTHRYAGELAIVARSNEDGLQSKLLGVPTVIFPMRNAVDFAVENLAGMIRRSRERRRPNDAVDRVD